MVVIGAGPAGEALARKARPARSRPRSWRSGSVGGVVLVLGLHALEGLLLVPRPRADEVRRVPGAAQALSGELDVDARSRAATEVIHGLDDSGAASSWLGERGIALVAAVRDSTEAAMAVGWPSTSPAIAATRQAGAIPRRQPRLVWPVGPREARPPPRWRRRLATSRRPSIVTRYCTSPT